METFFEFTILGLVAGCIYAMTATGLVVTYTTTGIFNFGHGGIGMISAFLYWQLTQGWHVPGVIAFILVLFVAAPIFGVVIERLLMRPLYGAPVDLSLVVTLGLLILLIGLANVLWSQQHTYNLPGFFNSAGFHV